MSFIGQSVHLLTKHAIYSNLLSTSWSTAVGSFIAKQNVSFLSIKIIPTFSTIYRIDYLNLCRRLHSNFCLYPDNASYVFDTSPRNDQDKWSTPLLNALKISIAKALFIDLAFGYFVKTSTEE